MYEMGMGELRLSPSSFYDMTLTEFFAAVRGYRECQSRVGREDWERIRWLATVGMQPHLKKNRRLKPTDLIRFPWENTVSDAPTEEQRLKSLERIRKRDRDKLK